MDWSPYQLAIFDDVANGVGHTVINAVAGSGKTSTIEAAVDHVPPGLSTLFVAFNKPIADELARRLSGVRDIDPKRGGDPVRTRSGKMVTVSTLHSYGLRTVTSGLGRLRIHKHRADDFLRESLGDAPDTNHLRRQLAKAVSLAKGVLAASVADVDDLVDAYGIEIPFFPGASSLEATREQFVDEVVRTLSRCRDTKDGALDFDDMIWLPIVHGLPQRQYDRVFVDECLPGPTPVLLADGSSRTIQDLVENRYSGDVLAFDSSTGKQRPCRVTGWQTVLNQKPLVKIKARWHKRKGTNRPTSFVICTEDHKVWANGMWLPAGDVKPGMVIQVETSAEKSQVGKITKRGRAKLAAEIRRKNAAGVMGSAKSLGFRGVRGGNGAGPTVPEQALMAELGDGWVWQYAIPTGKPRGQGYPTSYKVDIAKPGCKLAIEVDGESHRPRRAHDEKKDRLLESLGWTVVRVPNRRAVQNAKEEAERILAMSNCPIGAVVESVEPVTIPSFHVYDLTVEDLHCFYANGVLVHNCQDLNAAQVEMAMRSAKPDGRICMVGDKFQAICQFRGADQTMFARAAERLQAKTLPLSICYRCSRAVVGEVHRALPEIAIQAAPDAPAGTVKYAFRDEMEREARPGDFILSRTNAPLIGLCMRFLREGKRANIQGRDVGDSLSVFVRKSGARTVEKLRDYVEDWGEKECARLAAKRRDTQAVEDRVACLLELTDGAPSIAAVIGRIEELFSDSGSMDTITLSSTHKAKGLERDRVWMLVGTYLRRPGVEEQNLYYVAVTRARHTLIKVEGFEKRQRRWGTDADPPADPNNGLLPLDEVLS